MTEAEFRRAVDQALSGLPEHVAAAMDNVVVLVADQNDEDPDLYGLYTGTPLTERTGEGYAGSLPDAIEIYRHSLEADFGHDHDLLVHEIRVTVLHELGHHFGIGEDELDELGWS
jgi:predicted Zn-dependent protease with MMP-like domain